MRARGQVHCRGAVSGQGEKGCVAKLTAALSTLLTQGVAAVEEVVAAVAANNHPPIAPERRKALPSEAELDDYLLQNPETVGDAERAMMGGVP